MASAGPRRRTWWFVGGGLLVVAAAVVATVLATRHATPAAAPPSPTPARISFRFPTPTITSVALRGSPAPAVERSVGGKVDAALSAFYDLAFLDPASWAGPTPASAWAVFAPATQGRARADAGQLTLAATHSRFSVLRPSPDSSLSVHVLFDSRHKPLQAVATVAFVADGTLSSGAAVEVHSAGTFLLQDVQGKWLVLGYPNVATSMQAAPSPLPTATPSRSP